MIRDLSETLRAVLGDRTLVTLFPELAAAHVVFDRPSDTFNPAQTTIDLFLYDVRQNMELRSNEPQVSRSGDQITKARPPQRVACSYVVTAWPVGGTDVPLQEHRLLSQALEVLSRYPTIPTRFLTGKLKAAAALPQTAPVPLVAARTETKEPHEFWSALGSPMRASFVVTATIAIDLAFPAITGPKPKASVARVGLIDGTPPPV